MNNQLLTGTVEWVNYDLGEGFILEKTSEKVYYFHSTAFEKKEDFKLLEEGSAVEFTLIKSIYLEQIANIKRK